MNYETVPLEHVATLLSGGTPSKSKPEYWAGDIPWLTPKDMAQWVGKTDDAVSAEAIGNGTRLAPPHASFVAVRGMSLHNEIRIVRSERPLTFNQDIKAVVANEGVDPTFLYYALTARRQQLLEWVSAAGHGTGVLATDRLKSVPIPNLALRDQLALAALLSALDAKIELNRRTNETLEAMAQATFRDWFIDFGPVRRKLAGGTNPVEIMGGVVSSPARAAELAELFPGRLTAEDLPVGWERRPMTAFASIAGGKQLERSQIQDVGPNPVFGGAGIMGFTDLYNADDYVITVGRVGAYCGQFFGYRGRAWVNNNASLIRPHDGVPVSWLLLALRAADIDQIKRGAAQPFVSNGDVGNLPLLGPEPLAQTFSSIVDPLLRLQEQREAESATLAETRDYLLPRLMSGEVRVREVAEEIAA